MNICEPKCIHQKQIKILQCHRDTNRLFWSWAPMHPQRKYGQIWYQLSTYDPKWGWGSRRDLLGGSVARNFACLESTRARSGHMNLNIGNLPAISWISLTNVGHAGCYIGNLLEREPFGRPAMNWTTKFEQFFRVAWLEGGGCRCWPDGGGRIHQILYTVVEFVSQVVYIFLLFAPATWETKILFGCMIIEW